MAELKLKGWWLSYKSLEKESGRARFNIPFKQFNKLFCAHLCSHKPKYFHVFLWFCDFRRLCYALPSKAGRRNASKNQVLEITGRESCYCSQVLLACSLKTSGWPLWEHDSGLAGPLAWPSRFFVCTYVSPTAPPTSPDAVSNLTFVLTSVEAVVLVMVICRRGAKLNPLPFLPFLPSPAALNPSTAL